MSQRELKHRLEELFSSPAETPPVDPSREPDPTQPAQAASSRLTADASDTSSSAGGLKPALSGVEGEVEGSPDDGLKSPDGGLKSPDGSGDAPATSSRLTAVEPQTAEGFQADQIRQEQTTEREYDEREQLLADLAGRALQLQTAAEVSRAASSMLSLDELLPQTVELIRERFNLHYVGIFLVDEAERYAVLHAGSGEAGRIMLERGHKLAIGDTSMIGWCVANRQARIALDVGEDAVRFDNPWLPETRSELALPLISRGQVLGAMSVQSAKAAAFSEMDVAVLQTMADQVANAIANARLFEQTQQRVAELSAINAINQALTAQVELRAMLDLVVEKVRHLFDAPNAYIALYDRRTNLVEIPCLVEGDRRLSVDPFPLGQGLTSLVIQRRQPLLINGLKPRDGHDAALRAPELGAGLKPPDSKTVGAPVKSYLGVPIIFGQDVIGVMCIQDIEHEGLFGETEQRLLSIIAPSVGIAIQNARLFEQTQRRVADLTVIQKTMSALAGTLTREETIDVLLPHVASVVQADAVSMFLLEGEKLIRAGRYPVAEGEEAGIGQAIALADYPLTRQVIEARQAMAFLADDPQLQEHARQAFQAAGVTASATIPLVGREGVLGTLAISLRQPGRAFTEHDLSLLQTLADQATLTFERVHLLEETRRLARRAQLINQITGKVRAAASVDEVLRIAADELRQATHATRVTARLNTESWRSYLTSRPELTVESGPLETGQVAASSRLTAASSRLTAARLTTPIVIRDEVLGAFDLEDADGNRQWAEDELDLLNTIAGEVALAIENARLIEETQRRALRQTQLNQIAEKIQRASDVETILRVAAEELSQALDTSHANVRLGTAAVADHHTGKTGESP